MWNNFFSLIKSFFHHNNLKELKPSVLPFDISLLWLCFGLDVFGVFCDPFKCTASGNGYGLISLTLSFQDLIAKVHKNLLFMIPCSISTIAFSQLVLMWRKKNSDMMNMKNLIRWIGTWNTLAKQSAKCNII